MEILDTKGQPIEVSDEAFAEFAETREVPGILRPEVRQEQLRQSASEVKKQSGYRLSNVEADIRAEQTFDFLDKVYSRIVELRFLDTLQTQD